MKIYLFLVLLVVLPLISAQELPYSSFSSIELELDISSSAKVRYGENALLGSTTINLNSFPRTDDYQKVIYLYKNTNPPSVITQEKDKIIMEWEDLISKDISFSLESKVIRENDFKKIKTKIPFPIRTVPEEYKNYLKHTEFVDINDNIKNKANEIIAGETDTYIAAVKLANWVKENINYSLNTITANAVEKSSWVLENKEGVCDELTNLFLSMCRAVGIPAKFISGTVYTNIYDNFGNHGWAEIYLPDYGWIPVDVTFGQYGWIDPTHVKLMEVEDPGVPSVNYNWKSRNVDITPANLDIKTKITGMIGEIEPKTQIKVNLLKEKVGFGSNVPVEVNIKNLQDYYVPITLYASKAPKIFGSNTKNFVLRPKEEKNFYWIIKIDDNLNEGYIYTSLIEFRTVFGDYDTVKITYASEYETVTKKWAEMIVKALEKDDEKVFIFDIDLSCIFKKDLYYSNEIIDYMCEITNTGNIELKNLELCSIEECVTTDLSVLESKDFEFNIQAAEKIIMSVKVDDKVKTFPFQVDMKIAPEVLIIDHAPKKISFLDSGTINLKLFAKNTYRLKVQVDSQQIAYFEDSEKPTEYHLNITYPKNSFSKSYIPVTFTYEDSSGEDYKENKKLKLEIKDLPWYYRFINWLFNYSSL